MADVYRVVPGRGQQVRFGARTQVESYGGTTDQVRGEVRLSPDDLGKPVNGSLTVDTASLATGNGGRDSNMRRSFLQTDKYPTATFTLARIETPAKSLPLGKAVEGTVYGDLTLHGVTKAVAAKGSVTRETVAGKDTLHIVAAFAVRLADYKIGTPRFLLLVVKQGHQLTVDVRAVAA